jgi:hypothetical protein
LPRLHLETYVIHRDQTAKRACKTLRDNRWLRHHPSTIQYGQ